MYCNTCGAHVPTAAAFCPQCGHNLERQRQAQRQPSRGGKPARTARRQRSTLQRGAMGCAGLVALVFVLGGGVVALALFIETEADTPLPATRVAGETAARLQTPTPAPTAPPTPPPVPELGTEERPAGSGETVVVNERAITLHEVYTTSSLGGFTAPRGGYVFVVISVTIQNVSDTGSSHTHWVSYFSGKDEERDWDFTESSTWLAGRICMQASGLRDGSMV